jgi:site-specific DNA recombinase
LNTRYTGKTIWNTRRKVCARNRETPIYAAPQSEWVIGEAPQLRIVSDEVATAVRRRLQAVKSMFGRDGRGLTIGPKRYLFSELLNCSVVEASLLFLDAGETAQIAMVVQCITSVVTPYAKTQHWYVETSWSEAYSRGLRIHSVLRVEVTDYAVARMEQALRQRHEELNAELERVRQRKQQIEREIERLVHAIAQGQAPESLTVAIGEGETELRANYR